MSKLAVITTHPIQYYAPFFQLLTRRGHIELKVFYTWSQSELNKYDPDFKREVTWDLPLLTGYVYKFVNNVSAKPGSRHFRGIDNPSLISEIKSWNADAVLVLGWAFKSHLKALRYFKGKIPVFFRGDSNLLDEKTGLSSKKLFRRLFLSWVYRNVDVAFYVGKANMEYYLRHGLSRQKLVFAPHAIDNIRFAASVSSLARRRWRSERGIADRDVVFLFVGKFIAKKDPLTLLNAFQQADVKNAWLVFVGNGTLEAQMKAEARGLKNVLFEGFKNQSEMPLIYSICDVFVLPSVGPGETWGLAINEAMACSKPIIVSDRCGCAQDLVVEGQNGFIFKAGQSHQLSDLIGRCVNIGIGGLSVMGSQSAEKIKAYNISAVCLALEDTLLTYSG